MTFYNVQRQRTAGAYVTLHTFRYKDAAVKYLEGIAKAKPEFPYNGGDSWKDSKNIHNVNRYRIVAVNID